MSPPAAMVPPSPLEVASPSGLRAVFSEHGSLMRLECGGDWLLMYPATKLEAGPANLWLRRHGDGDVDWTPLLGPASSSNVMLGPSGPTAFGSWNGLSYTVRFAAAHNIRAWYWFVSVTNFGSEPETVDVVLTHDPSLAPGWAVRNNEYYVSQYLDITAIDTEVAGTTLAVRQNMPGERAPWLMMGSLQRGASWATDALQLVTHDRGIARFGALRFPSLPSSRLQHEHALVSLQDAPHLLHPGDSRITGFFGIYIDDHPAASGPADGRWAELARAQPEATAPTAAAAVPSTRGRAAGTLFGTAHALAARPLTDDELTTLGGGGARLHAESDNGTLLSYFTADGGHVVTADKELCVLRPHGHILHTGTTLLPDEEALTSTVWMRGGFHSQVTKGHVGRDALVSSRRSYLGLQHGHGLRLFVDRGDDATRWELLDLPSAWAVWPDRCSWWYATSDGLTLKVTSRAAPDRHELRLDVEVVTGSPRRVLAALHTIVGVDDALGAATAEVSAHERGVLVDGPDCSFEIRWIGDVDASVAGDEPLFDDGLTRDTTWTTITMSPARSWSLVMSAPVDATSSGELVGAAETSSFWNEIGSAVRLDAPSSCPLHDEVACIDAVLPWFVHNAFVHYVAPRGLEQYSGGGWGTRDVCQGPVGLLTAIDRFDVVRDVLLRVFGAQNERGDWPQGFEILPPVTDAGQGDAHGDIVYWPLLAIGDYLQATHDRSLLEQAVHYVGDSAATAAAPIEEHVRRALRWIGDATVKGTPMPAYGHGDWNDSLQPADPTHAARMTSVWTAVLQIQTLRSLSLGLGHCGVAARLAGEADDLADRTHEALRKLLDEAGLLPGYELFNDDGTIELLVHPTDQSTGLRYGILPWVHAIAADVLEPAAAHRHLEALRQHLLGPDGARLFDRPPPYSGGPMSVFQRAEAAAFWGREIGLMYMHAHLRYAEALARVGDGTGLFEALGQVNPIGVTERVPPARRRQSTCYFSSSDGAFADRCDAAARYDELIAGRVPLEGGWRVYSSGPGLFLRVLVEQLLGVRRRGPHLEIDPVLDPRLDGMRVTLPVDGVTLSLTFATGREGAGVRTVSVGGRRLDVTPLDNPFRRGGVRVVLDGLRELASGNRHVELDVATH